MYYYSFFSCITLFPPTSFYAIKGKVCSYIKALHPRQSAFHNHRADSTVSLNFWNTVDDRNADWTLGLWGMNKGDL